MERRERVNDNGCEHHLPEDIIHHIQSFLDAKQAAQTGLLSKPWYNAWLTRPNLDLNELDFQETDDSNPTLPTEGFWNFARNTMQRYEESNLRVETFRLQVHSIGPGSVSFSEELITKAAKMGVKDMDLASVYWQFDLPQQVLETETLVRLSVGGLMSIKPPGGMVNYPRLKSLTLERVRLESDCFTLMFPCLEDLTLRFCDVCEPIKISSSLLKCINLETVRELLPGILNFESVRELRAKFDVPSICKFKFSGPCYSTKLPMVSISTVSREWESDISLEVDKYLGKTWPQQLRRFMKKLSQSKVSVRLNFDGCVCCVYDEELKGKQGPLVENLMLSMPSLPSNIPRFFAGLFWSCPPKFITLFWFPDSCLKAEEKASNELIQFLCEELIQYRESCSTKNATMFGNLGLGEVRVESFDDTVGAWHSLPWKNLSSASMSPATVQKIRFRLEWGAHLRCVTRSARKILNDKPSHPPAGGASSSQSQPLLTKAPHGPSTRGRRRQLNPTADAPVPVNHARIQELQPQHMTHIQEIQQQREVSEFFLQRQAQIDHCSHMITRMKARLQLFSSRAAEHLRIQFPPLDNPTSGNDRPPPNSDVLDYVPPSEKPHIQELLREVLSLLDEVEREYEGFRRFGGEMHARFDRIEHILIRLQERMEVFFNKVAEPPLGIQFPPLDDPNDPTSENYRPPASDA